MPLELSWGQPLCPNLDILELVPRALMAMNGAISLNPWLLLHLVDAWDISSVPGHITIAEGSK